VGILAAGAFLFLFSYGDKIREWSHDGLLAAGGRRETEHLFGEESWILTFEK